VRCGRCGNENSEANRYCGMCGAPLIAVAAKPTQAGKPTQFVSTENVPAARPAAVSAPVAASPVPTAPRAATAGVPTGGNSVSAERRPAPVSSPEVGRSAGPVITGPSFLGLSTPGPARTGIRSEYSDHRSDDGGSNGGHDHLRPSSGNLDYLLDDEEEPKRGPGKLIFVVIALLLAGGFGYLHWKQGGFDWLNVGQKKPAASAPATPDATQSGADSGNASGTAASAPVPTPDGTGSQAGANGGAAPPASGAGATPADTSAAPTTATQSAPQSAAPQDAAPQTKPGDSGAAADSAAVDSAAPAAGADADKPAATEEPAAGIKPRTRKPAAVVAKPAAGRPFDMVSEGERYVYGRGVRQDCDHGTRLLKSAAEQSNPKAMISLGAMYSTGTCTPRDLPTAYRWFALALHKQPDNQALQDDLQKLWSQMTQPERQLAIKLSQ
jgi:cytoskeletal protein RodZ